MPSNPLPTWYYPMFRANPNQKPVSLQPGKMYLT
jgi:hypothetical protein